MSEAEVGSRADPDGTGTRRHLSTRQLRQSEREAGLIADRVIMAARPNAPKLEIERTIAEQCRLAGLAFTSRRSLIARTAFVRRHGTRETAAFAHQITIDRCFVIDTDGRCATLAMAVIEPPGNIVAWRLTNRPCDAATIAALLGDVLDGAENCAEPARIVARFGDDAGHAAIDAALAEAGATRIGVAYSHPSSGGDDPPSSRRPFRRRPDSISKEQEQPLGFED